MVAAAVGPAAVATHAALRSWVAAAGAAGVGNAGAAGKEVEEEMGIPREEEGKEEASAWEAGAVSVGRAGAARAAAAEEEAAGVVEGMGRAAGEG